MSKPHKSILTPLRAQHILSLYPTGTLATGLFFTKNQAAKLITERNQYWDKQKNLCINHLCIISHGSKTHKQVLLEKYKKEIASKASQRKYFELQ